MLAAFWLKNLNFAIELSGAITLLLATFLLFDTWTVKRELKTGLQGLGYIFLALYFLAVASQVSFSFSSYFILLLKEGGLAFLLAGLLVDRMNPVPKLTAALFLVPFYLISPFLFGIVTALYFLKATRGYDRHLIWVSAGFSLLATSDLISSLSFLGNSSYLILQSFYGPYSLAFYLENLLLLAGFGVLFYWSLGYLRFRLLSQLFLYFTVGTLVIFVITTFVFTTFLLNNIQNSVRDNLILSGKNFQYSLAQLEDRALITARGVATNDSVKASLQEGNRLSTYNQITEFFFPSKGDSLIVTDPKGIVIADSTDQGRFGLSISGKAVIQTAGTGYESVRIVSQNKNALPSLAIEAASPIKVGKTVIGISMATYSIDNFFVDSVKNTTGLDVTVYSGDVRAATTFLNPADRARLIGSTETNQDVAKKVLDQGQEASVTKQIFGKDYSAVYLPIKNLDNKSVGMVFVGRPASEIIAAANNSINLTFFMIAVLALLSIIPSYLLARYIDRHQKA